jgi:FAD/FMN-containing dehydrogenase
MEGYTLALDFPVKNGLFSFLNELDELVLEYGGRIYMSKDARMSKALLDKSYPRLETFKAILRKYNPDKKFTSVQSKRLLETEEKRLAYA